MIDCSVRRIDSWIRVARPVGSAASVSRARDPGLEPADDRSEAVVFENPVDDVVGIPLMCEPDHHVDVIGHHDRFLDPDAISSVGEHSDLLIDQAAERAVPGDPRSDASEAHTASVRDDRDEVDTRDVVAGCRVVPIFVQGEVHARVECDDPV